MRDQVARHENVAGIKYDMVRVICHTRDTAILDTDFFKNHWHEELEVTYNIKGNSAYFVDGVRIDAEPGQLIVIQPEYIHSIVPDSDSYDEGVVAVTVIIHPKFLEENVPRCREMVFTKEKRHVCPEIRSIIGELVKCVDDKGGDNEYFFYIKGLLLHLFYYMGKEGMIRYTKEKSETQWKNINLVKEVISYVEEHYREPIVQADVAGLFHYSKEYFSCFFKKHVGMTFTEYVMYYRVEKAKKELLESEKRVVDVALGNGFTDERRFISSFKKFYGVTPFQYRKHLLQEKYREYLK